MKTIVLFITLSLWLLASDVIIKKSVFSVDETLTNIEKIVTHKGFKVFGIIKHSPSSKLIIFGNPKIGDKLMAETPAVGLDLPMKVLVFQENNQVKIAYKNGTFLQKSYDLKNDKVIQKIDGALDKITNKAIQ